MLLMQAVPVYGGTYTEDGSANALVTADVSSSYSVMLPAVIALSDPDHDNNYTGTYKIGARGNINVEKKVICQPASSTFIMTGNNGDNITATVSQSHTSWVNRTPASGQKLITHVEDSGPYEDYSTIEGNVSALIVSAGTYSGNMEFTFSLADI